MRVKKVSKLNKENQEWFNQYAEQTEGCFAVILGGHVRMKLLEMQSQIEDLESQLSILTENIKTLKTKTNQERDNSTIEIERIINQIAEKIWKETSDESQCLNVGAFSVGIYDACYRKVKPLSYYGLETILEDTNNPVELYSWLLDNGFIVEGE